MTSYDPRKNIGENMMEFGQIKKGLKEGIMKRVQP